MHYYLAVDLGDEIVKFDATFATESQANLFADFIADVLTEYSYVQETRVDPIIRIDTIRVS